MHNKSAGQKARHADERNRNRTGRPSKQVSFLQPRNKEAGSEYQLKRQRADSKCSAYADEVKRLQQRECRCSDKCAGAWSDTPHGSHNMQCKVAYQRFLGLREKYLTDDHQSRPNSASFYRFSAIRVLEFMCGIAMLSAVWAAAGALICGLCECKERLLGVVAEDYPNVLLSTDARSDEWKHWQLHAKADVVTGGPPCNPYSAAGAGA